MTSYEDSPPDEGYSEDPLTVSQSGALPPWMASMTAQERLGELETQQLGSVLKPNVFLQTM